MISNVADLITLQTQAQAQGANVMGQLLWWDLGACRISHNDLVALAVQYGAPREYLPVEISPINAFKRAYNRVQKRLPEDLQLEKVSREPEDFEQWIVLKQRTADKKAKDVEFETVQKVCFNIQKLTFEGDRSHEAGAPAMFEEEFQTALMHDTSDIRKVLQSFNNHSSFSLRDSGGVYFAPLSVQDDLNAIANLVEAVSSLNKVYRIPLTDLPQVQTTMSNLAQKTLEQEIASLDSDIQELFDDAKIKQSTLKHRLPEVRRIQSRVKLFSDVLSVQAQSLQSKLTVIQNALHKELGLAPVQTPSATPTPIKPQSQPAQPVYDQAAGF